MQTKLTTNTSDTERISYLFILDHNFEDTLILEMYVVERKEHDEWTTHGYHDRAYKNSSTIEEKDIILSEEIKQMAVNQFITEFAARLTAQKYSDYRKDRL
jgi:hypothetical protein